MDFNSASKLGSILSKEYAAEFFRLLLTYKDISASEAASRLNQHIKTAQDFLEGLHDLKIIDKTEVYEGKRPYNRYKLKSKKISFNIDLTQLSDNENESNNENKKIRERKNSGALFSAPGSKPIISSVTFWTGSGRQKKERKISLTTNQGKFLYFLPFPNAKYKNVFQIMNEAGLNESYFDEIYDIVIMLEENNIVETD